MRLAAILSALEDLKGIVPFQGLKIRIENPRGSTRKGVDKKTGRKWSVDMTYPYGEIIGVDGVDGDLLDCFIGPDPTSKFVHVIHILQSDGSVDEDKVMLGFANSTQAKQALIENYNSPKFYGGMDTMRIEEFKKKLKGIKTTGPQIIRASAKPFKVGDEVFIDGGHRTKGTVREINGRRLIIQLLSNLVLSRDVSMVHHWDEGHVSRTWVGNRKKSASFGMENS